MVDPSNHAIEDDRDELKPLMLRYAARYHLAGPEKNALVEQTLAAPANDPDALLDGLSEKAIAETMERLAQRNLADAHQRPRGTSIGGGD